MKGLNLAKLETQPPDYQGSLTDSLDNIHGDKHQEGHAKQEKTQTS
jgi:hypothetical protein